MRVVALMSRGLLRSEYLNVEVDLLLVMRISSQWYLVNSHPVRQLLPLCHTY